MRRDGTQVIWGGTELPRCDFCKDQGKETPAAVDGATVYGPWALMCGAHHAFFGQGLGLGRGQELVSK